MPDDDPFSTAAPGICPACGEPGVPFRLGIASGDRRTLILKCHTCGDYWRVEARDGDLPPYIRPRRPE